MKKIFSLIISLAFLTFSALAAPVMVGTVTEKAEDESFVDFKEVAKLEAQADYGELILDIDFESRKPDTTGFTSLLPVEYPGKSIVGMPASFTPTAGNGFTPADAAFVKENGNTFMRYTAVKSYIQMYLKASSALPAGKYTISIDLRCPDINGTTPLYNLNTTYSSFNDIEGHSNLWFKENTADFVTKVYRGELKSNVSFDLLEYLISYANAGLVMEYDNIRVWYDNGTYSVNFNDGGIGSCKSIANSTTVTKGESIKLSDYSAQASDGTKFLGWSLLPFGQVIDSDTFTPSETSTLYAVWDFGAKIIEYDFESSETGTKLTTAIPDAYFPAKDYAAFKGMSVEFGGITADNTLVKADEKGNKYLSVSTAKTYNFLKFKDEGGYPGGTYTFAYIAKMDNHPNNSSEVALNSMCSWADNSYKSQMNTLSANASKVGFKSCDTWKAFRITAQTIDGQPPEYIIALLTDNTSAKGSILGIDNIVIYYNAPEKTVEPQVTVKEYDYRKGRFDITLDKDYGISQDEAHSLFFETTDLFDAACIKTVGDDGCVTYSFYEESAYKGKSVKLVSKAVYKTPEATMFIGFPDNIAGKTYTFNTIPDDGENLVPNGDVTNPYFNPFTDIAQFKPITVVDGAFNVELRTDLESWNQRQSLITDQVDFKAGENYYIDIDIDFVKEPQHADGTPNPYVDGTSEAIFVYIPDSKTSGTVTKERPAYIKGMTTKNSFSISKKRLGTDQGNYSIVYKADSDVTAPQMAFNFDFTYPASLFASSRANGVVKGAGGLGVVIKNFTIKKMYDVNILDAKGNVSETRLAAKNVTITLPESFTLTSSTDTFLGWTDGEKLYGLGEDFVLTQAKDVTLTAVVQGVAPKSFKENSIRVNDPQGIRFKSAVTRKVRDDEKTTEYGFLVTRESLLGGKNADYLTFEQKDVRYITGVSYGYDSVAEKNVDRIYDMDQTFTYFTAAVYGISPSKENYEENIIVRPYIKYDGEIIYGTPMTRSVLSVAKSIEESGYEGYDEAAKMVVKKIFEVCGEES